MIGPTRNGRPLEDSSANGASEAAQSREVQLVIQQALAGNLPRPRDLKYWEPVSLTMRHIQMIFDRALGMTNSEIMAKYDMDASRVSVILNHPDAETVMSVIAGKIADRITDPIARFKATAGEASNELIAGMRTSKDEKHRRKCALDILSMAGYGAPKKVEADVNHNFNVPAPIANRLADTLDQAKEVAAEDYRIYTQVPASTGSDGSPIPSMEPEVPERVVGQPPAGGSQLAERAA